MTPTLVRAANRTARLLAHIASSLGDREYISTVKLNRSTYLKGSYILPLRYDYRASDDIVKLMCILSGNTVRLRIRAADDAEQAWQPGKLLFTAELDYLNRGDILSLGLLHPSITRNNEIIPVKTYSTPSSNGRRFITEIQQITEEKCYFRFCSHYLPFTGKVIDKEYYFGEDYNNYLASAWPAQAVSMLRGYGCGGRLLDVGCALGVYTRAFLDAGFDAYGVDISPFAVAQAQRLVGGDHAKCADLDVQEIPFSGRFETIWMWDVLEHFRVPDAVLAKVSERAAQGTLLFLHTSNAESLTHRLFARDWEGYSDYSHRGVDQVTCKSLRGWLARLGWKITNFECGGVWIAGSDPVMLRLRDVFTWMPELKSLLEEADLGDFITLVATKQ
jgi:2-polyprenyl-3-methyl-5-hydroxy-6-metoxy-1,4-benzoquinol methylase